MKNFIYKIKSFVVAHKIMSTVLLLAILGVGFWGYKKFTSTTGDTRYVTAKVEKGAIIASISGSGQVSSLNQIDIKPKTGGDITYIAVKEGQKVGAGALIATLDNRDAEKAVRDAEISLQSTKLSLQKLKIQNSAENISADLSKAYDDGFTTVSDTFLDLPTVVTGLEDVLGQNNLSEDKAREAGKTAQDYREKANTSYYSAKTAFETNRKNYRLLSNTSPKGDIEKIIKETYETTKLLSDAIKNNANFVDYMAERSNNPADFSSSKTNVSTYTDTINGHLSSLLAGETTIEDNQDSSENNSLDIKNEELSVQQKENSLEDAKDKLRDYSIRAPFDGTIASVDMKKSDSVSAGTAVATLITIKQIAEVSLNEVDVAKIKEGLKATLTFDAIPDLTISGAVADIDVIGTVSQGVVTYNVKIGFDTEDPRVKPGMSVSAAIITDMKQDVLTVPNGAVKSQGGQSYVEMFDSPLIAPTDGLIGTISKIAPNKIPVVVGLSNDSESEIVSGIKEGDEIVVRTILPTSTKTTTAAPSIFGGGANTNRGAAGGGARFQAR